MRSGCKDVGSVAFYTSSLLYDGITATIDALRVEISINVRMNNQPTSKYQTDVHKQRNTRTTK